MVGMTDSFTRWVEEHHEDVYRAALRITRGPPDAEDVAQQVFVKALADRERLERADDVSAVLRWLAVKTALHHLRTEERRRAREDRVANDETDPTPSPHEQQSTREERRALEQAIARLPDDLRVPLVLRYHESLTLRAIASAERCSEPTILDRIRRAIDRLRHELGVVGTPALAVGLEARLEHSAPVIPGTPAAPAPRLKDELLRLARSAPAAAPAALGAKLAAAVAIVAALAGGSWIALRQNTATATKSDPSAAVSTSPGAPAMTSESAQDPPRPERADVGTTPRGEAAEATAGVERRPGTIVGRLRLPVLGLPSPFRVSTSSIARDGKMSADGAFGEVDASGAFTVHVSVHRDDGEDVRLHVLYGECSVRAPQELRVHSGETIDVGLLDDVAPIAERTGAWRLDLLVRTPDGAPLPRAAVRMSRRIPTYTGVFAEPWECGGLADETGVVHLAGEALGPKSIEVTTTGEDLVDYGATFDVLDPGFTRREITLEVKHRYQKHADGFFTPLDERPVLCEVRGRLFDAGTRAPLATPHPDVDLVRVEARSREEFELDVVPNLLIPAPVQQLDTGATPPDPTDRFTIVVREKGTFAVVGRFEGRPSVVRGPFELPGGAPSDDIELAFPEPVTVHGVVTDETGAPLEGAVLVVTGTGPMSDRAISERDNEMRKAAGEGTFWFSHARSKADGSFSIGGLPAGALIRVAALDPYHEPARSGAFRAAADGERVAIRFDRKRVR